MEQFTINIEQICQANKVTREHGKVIHDIIMQNWDSFDRIVVDFDNILIASVSFFDEAFGALSVRYSTDEIARKLKLMNIREFDRNLANSIYTSRLRQKKLQNHGG